MYVHTIHYVTSIYTYFSEWDFHSVNRFNFLLITFDHWVFRWRESGGEGILSLYVQYVQYMNENHQHYHHHHHLSTYLQNIRSNSISIYLCTKWNNFKTKKKKVKKALLLFISARTEPKKKEREGEKNEDATNHLREISFRSRCCRGWSSSWATHYRHFAGAGAAAAAAVGVVYCASSGE